MRVREFYIFSWPKNKIKKHAQVKSAAFESIEAPAQRSNVKRIVSSGVSYNTGYSLIIFNSIGIVKTLIGKLTTVLVVNDADCGDTTK